MRSSRCMVVWSCRNGILLSSSFHTAIFSLLTALVVYSAKSLFGTWERNPNVQWNSGNTGQPPQPQP